MKTLTTPKALPNLTRWTVDDFEPHEKAGWAVITLLLQSPAATSYAISKQVFIRNGKSDRVDYVAAVGGEIQAQLVVTPAALDTPTGCTDAVNAFRAGATAQARRDAVETWMLTAGIAGASLAGT